MMQYVAKNSLNMYKKNLLLLGLTQKKYYTQIVVKTA